MDLKQFIKQTIRAIAEAVVESQSELSAHVEVVPPVKSSYESLQHQISETQPIRFDVAVTVNEEADSQHQIGIFSSIVGAGVSGGEKAGNQNATRIQFVVPIKLRRMPGGKKPAP